MTGAGLLLGAHQPGWPARVGVPVTASHRTLRGRRRLRCRWTLDSGGFTELPLFGRWQTSPAAYAAAVTHCRDETGRVARTSLQPLLVS